MATTERPSGHSSAREGEVKPPANVKVGLLFLTHELYSKDEVTAASIQLKQFLKGTFSPGKKNTFLLESASSRQTAIEFEEREREGYARFGSFRAGRIYSFLTREGKNMPDSFYSDPSVLSEAEEIFGNPEKDPIDAFIWTVYTVLDELNQQDYGISMVHETGLEILEPVEEKKEMNYQQYQAMMKRFAAQQDKRDQQTVAQLTGLVDVAEKQNGDTNIVGVFGRNHQVIVDGLPERIQAVTTFIAEPIEGTPQDQIEMFLRAGQEVPEELWTEAFYGKKGGWRGFVHKAATRLLKATDTER